jgi:hypothetical protein
MGRTERIAAISMITRGILVVAIMQPFLILLEIERL